MNINHTNSFTVTSPVPLVSSLSSNPVSLSSVSNTVLPILASAATALEGSSLTRPVVSFVSSTSSSSSSNISSIGSTHPVLLKKYFRYKFREFILETLKKELILPKTGIEDLEIEYEPNWMKLGSLDPEFHVKLNYYIKVEGYHQQIPVPNGQLLLGDEGLYLAMLKSVKDKDINRKLKEELSEGIFFDSMSERLKLLIERRILRLSEFDIVNDSLEEASLSKERWKQLISKSEELDYINRNLAQKIFERHMGFCVEGLTEFAKRMAITKKPDVVVSCQSNLKISLSKEFLVEEEAFLASKSEDVRQAYGLRNEPIRDAAINHIRLAYQDDNSPTFPFQLYIQPNALIYETFQTIDKAINEGKTIYIHCTAGCSRSPALTMLYIATRAGLSFEEAHRFVKLYRSAVLDYVVMKYQPIFLEAGDQTITSRVHISGIMKFFHDNLDSVNALCNPPSSHVSITAEKVAYLVTSYALEISNPEIAEIVFEMLENLFIS